MSSLTCVSLDLHSADSFTHGNERVVIFLQALISFLVQSSKGPELCPIKFLALGVKDDSKGGHYTVEISLLTTSPSNMSQRKQRQICEEVQLKKRN